MQKMRILRLFAVLVVATACANATAQFNPDAIIATERAALDRWGKGDPQGYLETYAPEVTYFDPMSEHRIDGLATMQALYGPIKGRVQVDHYDMIDPRVQLHGDVAVLSYNLASYVKRPNGDSFVVRWNSTAVYRQISGKWKIIHSHWSFTRPELKQPIGE